MAVAGAAWGRRLPWDKSWDGLALCGCARAARTRGPAVWNALPPIAVGRKRGFP
jgi:hypothetical protein